MKRYYRNRLYRSKHGEIFGVCQGIAEWRDFSADSVRLVVILLAVFTGFFPVLAVYLAAAFLLPTEPSAYESGSRRWRDAAEDLKGEFENLKSKVSGMEDRIFRNHTDEEAAWDERFRGNR